MKVALDRGDVERLSPLGIHPTVRAQLRAWLDSDPSTAEAIHHVEAPMDPVTIDLQLGLELDKRARAFAARQVMLTPAAVIRAAVTADMAQRREANR